MPSNRVAIVSRNVFCGANNPFITGIFPARCRSPHQSSWRDGASRSKNVCELLAFKPPVLYANTEPSGQLSTTRFLVARSARDARTTRAPRASVACGKRSSETESTGAVQVIAGAGRESERVPCQRFDYCAGGFNDHLSAARNGG